MLTIGYIADLILLIWCAKHGIGCGMVAMIILFLKYALMFNVAFLGMMYHATKEDEDLKDLI